MNISFSNAKLQKLAHNKKDSLKTLGQIRSDKYDRRLQQLYAAQTLEDVRYLPGNFHELVGNRKGQWAADLDQPYRLIFRPLENPIPTDDAGKYIWAEILSIEIIEIADYH